MAKHCKLLMVIRKVNFSFLALLQLRSMRSRATCLRSLLQMRYTTTCRQLQLKNAMTGSELFKLFQSLENNCIKHFNSKGTLDNILCTFMSYIYTYKIAMFHFLHSKCDIPFETQKRLRKGYIIEHV